MIAVVTAVVPVLVFYAVRFARGKVLSLIQQIENEAVQTTLTGAAEIVLKAVTTVSQTYVDTLKQHGSFTADAQREAFERAKAYVLTLLNTEAKDLLTEIYGNLDVWLETMIESTVNGLKMPGQDNTGSGQIKD